MKKFSRSELKMLSSTQGLHYLLQQEVPDFEQVVTRISYEARLEKLQAQLIQVQNRVQDQGKRVMILFEGREFAGKGRTLNACTEHLNPRAYRKVALDKPNEKEREQWYFKRYIEQIPEKGEMVFFDRSWYNRAVVEPVNGFCSRRDYQTFMEQVNFFEEMLIDDGIIFIKFYLSITKAEQIRRIREAQETPLLQWQLSQIDLEAPGKWNTYSRYTNQMLKKTNGGKNPWSVIEADDPLKAALAVIALLLRRIPH